MIHNRAETNQQKKEITQRLFKAWKKYPELRLTQLITCATGGYDNFNTEDYELIETIEEFVSPGSGDDDA